MPELPEVERGRKIAERVAAGRSFENVECAKDGIVFEGVTSDRFARAVRGRRVREVHRRGKHIWFRLDRAPHPLFHFGMTGAFRVPGEAPIPLESSPKEPGDEWPPRFTKVLFRLSDGGELAFTNARRLGRIRLRDDPEGEPPVSRLGFDPLLDLPSAAELARRMEGRKISVKGLLLDQSFAAGVGNWIADEVLYQAGIDPRRSAASLTRAEVTRLRNRLGKVVSTAVSVDAEKDRFPAGWLFHRRWGQKRDARTSRGERIEHLKVAGRTTAWVPSRQS